jgi:hypothetical protein
MILDNCDSCSQPERNYSGPNSVCDCVASPEYVGEGIGRLERMLGLHWTLEDYLARRVTE